jgi:hypothetical protein
MRPWDTRTAGTMEAVGLGGFAGSSVEGKGAVGKGGEGEGDGILCEWSAGVFGSVTSPSHDEGRRMTSKECGESCLDMLGPLEEAGEFDRARTKTV